MACTEYPLCKYAFYEKQPNKMMVLVDVNNFGEIEMFKSVGFVPMIGTNSVYGGLVIISNLPTGKSSVRKSTFPIP